jgi:CelD/BcsL family acetyltransferase involved in cellulose biosynthesis
MRTARQPRRQRAPEWSSTPDMSWQFLPASRFSEHASDWDALQRATTDTPFLASAFLAPALAEFGTGKELLALHRQGGRLDAATLVRPAGRGMWETFQPSQLPLGPWLASAQDDLPARTRSLVQALPGLALGLGLTQLDPRLHPRPADTRDLRLLDYIHTSYVDIAGSFDSYWEARGKNLRQNTKKQRNKVLAEGTAPVLECVSDPAGVAQALADYGRLETTGWKAGGGTAIHPDNAQGRFYLAMLQNFCAAGHGRIYRYRFGEQVVAMDLCIDNGPMVVILKTAYDEAFKSVSPATLMRQEQFAAWWGEGRYQRIEFYGKTLEWHTRWTDTGRTLYHATQYRLPWLRALHEQWQRRQPAAAEPAQEATG